MQLLTGQSIGRYHILEQVGQGGMALVYKAFDTRLERNVAIKIIRIDQFPPAMLDRILKRFEREAKALARLNHPNIVKVHDFGEYKNAPYLVMDYLPGETLKQLEKPLPWEDTFRLVRPIADALNYAHTHGILHRDVKPSNIILTENGMPVLTDFGISKLLDANEGYTLTGTGVGVGTPEYMAPEQGLGKEIDGRADQYSLGIVLYELITGRKPYQADTPMAVLLKQCNDPLPRPREYIPDLPEEVELLLFKALAKDPEDRYQNMAAFKNALEKLPGNEYTGVAKKTQIDINPNRNYEDIYFETVNDLSSQSGIHNSANRQSKRLSDWFFLIPATFFIFLVLFLWLQYQNSISIITQLAETPLIETIIPAYQSSADVQPISIITNTSETIIFPSTPTMKTAPSKTYTITISPTALSTSMKTSLPTFTLTLIQTLTPIATEYPNAIPMNPLPTWTITKTKEPIKPALDETEEIESHRLAFVTQLGTGDILYGYNLESKELSPLKKNYYGSWIFENASLVYKNNVLYLTEPEYICVGLCNQFKDNRLTIKVNTGTETVSSSEWVYGRLYRVLKREAPYARSHILVNGVEIFKNNESKFYNPIWDYHGNNFIFLSSYNGTSEIYLSVKNGTKYNTLKLISESGVEYTTPSWSYDGKKLFFSRKNYLNKPNFNPCSLDLPIDDGVTSNFEIKFLMQTDQDEIYPIISPDGKYLAFSRRMGNDYEIFIRELATQKEIQVTNNGSHDILPIWLPN